MPLTRHIQESSDSTSLFICYRQWTLLYEKASSCGLPREMEYLSELILHLLHDESSSLTDDQLHEILLCFGHRDPIPLSNNIGHSQQRPSNQIKLEIKRNLLIHEWTWRRLRSLFLQGRYLVALAEIDKVCGHEFFIWNYDVSTTTVELRDERNQETFKSLDGQSRSEDGDYFWSRCAYLKMLVLEKLQRFGDLMSFASPFLDHLNKPDSYCIADLMDSAGEAAARNKSTNNSSSIRQCFQSKVLALQGRVMQYNGINDLATDCYLKAVRTSLQHVPWVLPILIGTHRLTYSQEVQLIEDLDVDTKSSNNDTYPSTSHLLEPFRYALSHGMSIEQNSSLVPIEIRQSIDFWELTASKLIDSGCIREAYTLCSRTLSRPQYRWRWRLHRIQLEALFFGVSNVSHSSSFPDSRPIARQCVLTGCVNGQRCTESGCAPNSLRLKTMELKSGWPETPEYWLASGLLSISELQLQRAIEVFDEGLKRVPTALQNNLYQSDIELYFLLFKMLCWFRLGEVLHAHEIVETLQLKYSNSPFTELYATRIQLALAACGSGTFSLPRCPDAIVLARHPKLPCRRGWHAAPILWKYPFHDEAYGDIAICHERLDVSCTHYTQAFESLSHVSPDCPMFVDRYSLCHCALDTHRHPIWCIMLRVSIKLLFLLSKLRSLEDAKNAVNAGLAKFSHSMLTTGHASVDTTCIIRKFREHVCSADGARLLEVFFSLPTILNAPVGNSLYRHLMQAALELQSIAQGISTTDHSLERLDEHHCSGTILYFK